MKKNRLNLWASRLRSIVAAGLMLLVSASAMADDQLTVKANVKAGASGQIAISLDNETPYTAFQVEVVLPEGLTLAASNAVELSTRATASHNVMYNEVETGKVRIVVYSFDGSVGNEAFDGTSGDLLLVNVTAASDYAASDVTLNDVLFVSQSDLTGIELGYENENGILGDVNGDGIVDMKDALAVIKYYLGQNPADFNEAVADINDDGAIDMKDALEVVKIYKNN